MKNKKRLYNIISSFLLIISILILIIIDKTNNIKLSLAIQFLIITLLIKLTFDCLSHVKNQYKNQKYSYSIIMNLGLILFLIINIFRQINLLIENWNSISINDIYINTLNSFSYFATFILPLIIILSFYCIITNIILIKKEGFCFQNVLGITFGICVFLGALSNQLIYNFLKNIELLNLQIYIKKFVDIGLNSILCYFYCLTISTLYCNIMAAKHKPHLDKDFIIILGAKIKNDGTLTPLVKARVDKAISFAKEQKEKNGKNIIFIPSGGQGQDEIMSEAEAMKNYLIQNNINPEDIIIENESTNTLENMTFSKEKIDKINKNGKIIFATTNYHVFRCGAIANKKGIDCEGIGSKTKWYFYTNALVREFLANLFLQKKQHVIIIIIINIILFILIAIGYQYKLI